MGRFEDKGSLATVVHDTFSSQSNYAPVLAATASEIPQQKLSRHKVSDPYYHQVIKVSIR